MYKGVPGMLHEFTINVPYKDIEAFTEKLNVVGVYNLYYEPPIEIIKIQNGYGVEEKVDDKVDLKIYASDQEVENLPMAYFDIIQSTLAVSKEEIKHTSRDEASWGDDFKFEDVDLGNGWVIVYPDSTEVYTGKNVLKFDPLAAFGTGLHETTQSCLRLLLNKELTGKKLLDLGTGSGMLAIAASLKGAAKVVAVDYEPVERELRHNAQLNEVTNDIEIVQADLIDGDYAINDNYDLIIINIGGDETAAILKKHHLLKRSNDFIVSGLVEWHTESLIEQFKASGFSIKEKLHTHEWVTIYFTKSN